MTMHTVALMHFGSHGLSVRRVLKDMVKFEGRI
jgi:hypothetical protein